MSNQEIIYGINSLVALLNANASSVLQLFVDKKRSDKRVQAIIQLAQDNNISVSYENRARLDELSQGGNHQGVAARCEMPSTHDEALLDSLLEKNEQPLFLVLDCVQDPHNLGACLRTADAVGVSAVIIPKDRSASITSTVVKVASGAAYTVPVISVTNLSRTIRHMQELGVWFVGADGASEQSLYDVKLTGSIALVMGAEGTGLRRLTKELCDFLVRLPMTGTVESLNVSVATGVCLFEALRQRSGGSIKD
jgi:23S rRNA (guanosine2251-2'-O)-methyltransferase